RFRNRFDGVTTSSFTACLSDSNWPVKRSGYLLINSREVRFTTSIRTLPNSNSPDSRIDKQVAFNINFANQGPVKSVRDSSPCQVSRDTWQFSTCANISLNSKSSWQGGELIGRSRVACARI